nr:retrovirus-related Pol polyprotein from transposon TNT 1-94 [Tanacetum cinerariifolium]
MVTKFDINKFGGKISFAIWKVHMQAVLTHHGYKKALKGIAHKPQSTSVQDHLDEFNTILIDLENLDVDIDDEDKSILLVISLPTSYKHFKEIVLYGNHETLSFDDVKSALLSKQKYDDDVEPESGEGMVARGRSSSRESKLEREGKGNNENKPKKAAEVAIAKGDSDGDVYLAINTKKSTDELIVDSCCTYHMIPHQCWFTTYELFNGGNVYMGNHSICPVIRNGNIQVNMHDGVVRTITRVRHVPELKRNLISFSILEANGCKYYGKGRVMKIIKGALVLMKAIQSCGLYVLQGTVKLLELLHQRQALMIPSFGIIAWVTWVRKKRVSFSPSIHRMRDALHYIHSNLWGPSPVMSRGVYVHVNEGKLVPHAVKCIFLGYGSRIKGCHVWCHDLKYHKSIHSIDVTFNEDVIINSGKDFVPPHNVDNNHTEELVKLSKEKRVISCKWLFKVKDGIPEVGSNRYKAWYVVHRFDQREGIDFNEVFSLVVHHTSIRVLLFVVALQDLELEQFDVKTTFLHGHLKEEIYVEQPEGFKVPRKEDHVCGLKKSLYSLKQSPRQWYKRFDSFMIGHGYDHYSYDECVYLRKFPDGSFLYLTDYISKVLKKFNMSSCKPVPTPLAQHFKLSSYDCPKSEEDKEDMSCVSYSSAVGSLIWYSSLQAITNLSTTKEEYISSIEGVKEAIWLRGTVNKFGLPQEILVMYCDNQSAVYLTKNNKFHSDSCRCTIENKP